MQKLFLHLSRHLVIKIPKKSFQRKQPTEQ